MRVQGVGGKDAVGDDEVLEGNRPAVPVRTLGVSGDGGNQALAEGLAVTGEATRLAGELVRRGALPKKATVDAFTSVSPPLTRSSIC